MNIDVNDLLFFAKVIDHGSFTTAAEHLEVPKSTLSRRITLLEQQLGERLLIRSTRGISITEFGQSVLMHAQAITEEASAVADLVGYRQIIPQGRLKISMPPDFMDFIQQDFFKQFIHKYPAIFLELDFSSRLIDLASENFDFAIRMASKLSDDNNIVARPIKEIKGGLYASSDYLKKHGTPTTPRELELQHVGLHLANSMGEIQRWQLKNGEQAWSGFSKGPVVTNSMKMLHLLATQGLGIAALSTTWVDQSLKKGELVRVLENWEIPPITMWAITLGRKLLPMKTQILLEELKQAIL